MILYNYAPVLIGRIAGLGCASVCLFAFPIKNSKSYTKKRRKTNIGVNVVTVCLHLGQKVKGQH